jgi:hypothetical protein
MRTHDPDVARPLAAFWLGSDLGEPEPVWAKIVPWCTCGGGHDSHVETRPITEPRQTGWAPALVYGEDDASPEKGESGESRG